MLLLQACILCSAHLGLTDGEGEGVGAAEVEEVLADFPLDDPGGATDRIDTEAEGQGLNE